MVLINSPGARFRKHDNPVDTAHDLVRDLAHNCDIAGVSHLWRAVLGLNPSDTDHGDNLKHHWLNLRVRRLEDAKTKGICRLIRIDQALT